MVHLIHKFTVSVDDRKLYVRVVPTIKDVDVLMVGSSRSLQKCTPAYFSTHPTNSGGTITLATNAITIDTIAHECSHAATWNAKLQHDSKYDKEEQMARYVGKWTQKIVNKLKLLGHTVK
jgi:hypothetical protein